MSQDPKHDPAPLTRLLGNWNFLRTTVRKRVFTRTDRVLVLAAVGAVDGLSNLADIVLRGAHELENIGVGEGSRRLGSARKQERTGLSSH